MPDNEKNKSAEQIPQGPCRLCALREEEEKRRKEEEEYKLRVLELFHEQQRKERRWRWRRRLRIDYIDPYKPSPRVVGK